jgi:ABC-type multidrug transport system ATPase subunit
VNTRRAAGIVQAERTVVLSLRSVSVSYRAGVSGCGARARVLNTIELDITDGEIVGVIGAKRSGKTTLLQCAGGMLEPDDGVVELRGPLLLIDEPFIGDRGGRRELRRAIDVARASGISVLLASAHADAVHRAASRVLFLERGRLMAPLARGRSVDSPSGEP